MNSQLLEKIEKAQTKKVPDLRAGDTVRVHQKIREGKKERVQVFEGIVLRVKGGGLRRSFLVRKISFGVGVEKNFLIHAPNIVKIEVKKRAEVRRAYLTYLRKLTGKGARLKDKQFDALVVNVKEEEPVEELTEEAKKDAEVTELSQEEVADSNIEEVPLSEVEKEEEKEAKAEDVAGSESADEGGQAAEVAETEEGIEEADKDAEKGKDKDEKDFPAEKTAEDKTE